MSHKKTPEEKAATKRAQRRRRYLKHKDKMLAASKAWAKKNPERVKELHRIWYAKNREHVLALNRIWVKNNKGRVREYQNEWRRNRYANDASFRISVRIRNRIQRALKSQSVAKCFQTEELVGLNKRDFMAYIESKFLPGMSWENYGHDTWHIDHIAACSLWDLTDPEQQKKCFHYTNLQPLWAPDNLDKSNLTVEEWERKNKTG